LAKSSSALSSSHNLEAHSLASPQNNYGVARSTTSKKLRVLIIVHLVSSVFAGRVVCTTFESFSISFAYHETHAEAIRSLFGIGGGLADTGFLAYQVIMQ